VKQKLTDLNCSNCCSTFLFSNCKSASSGLKQFFSSKMEAINSSGSQVVAVLDIRDTGCPDDGRHIPQLLQENTGLSPPMSSRVFFFCILPNSLQQSYTIYNVQCQRTFCLPVCCPDIKIL